MNDTFKHKMPKQLKTLEDVTQLCEYAIEATGTATDSDRGMCAGLQFVVDCIKGKTT